MATGIHRIHQGQVTSDRQEEEAAKKYFVKVDNIDRYNNLNFLLLFLHHSFER
jgi:hypothetical protein